MAAAERFKLIAHIEESRQSKMICYLTSLRPNVPGQISDDAVRVFFDHLLTLPSRPVRKLDIFLCSNGGSGTVPWRLVSLFREFAQEFNVLIPYRAYSAASLLALGANEIVMHPFAELGPIDPTVTNEFNPTDPLTNQRQGISVEDVTAYVNFIKSTVGITHEDELVQAIKILAEKVHPLALGNVERFIAQSRMIARKILRTHMGEQDTHTIDEIVENMASKLYFHGHPINRQEARNDLRLKVATEVSRDLEDTMWALYKDYEEEFQNLNIFNPAAELVATPATPVMPQPMPPPGALPQQVAVQAPMLMQPPQKDYDLMHAIVESMALSSAFKSTTRYQIVGVNPAGQPLIRADVLAQQWTHQPGSEIG